MGTDTPLIVALENRYPDRLRIARHAAAQFVIAQKCARIEVVPAPRIDGATELELDALMHEALRRAELVRLESAAHIGISLVEGCISVRSSILSWQRQCFPIVTIMAATEKGYVRTRIQGPTVPHEIVQSFGEQFGRIIAKLNAARTGTADSYAEAVSECIQEALAECDYRAGVTWQSIH